MLMRRTPGNRWLDRWVEDVRDELRGMMTPFGETELDGDFSLALDVDENDNAYHVKTAIPGVKPEDIQVRLHDNVLTISAEIQDEHEEENGKRIIRERRYGKYARSVRFPVPVKSDEVEAEYENGVLMLSVPKSEAVQPRQIEIKRK